MMKQLQNNSGWPILPRRSEQRAVLLLLGLFIAITTASTLLAPEVPAPLQQPDQQIIRANKPSLNSSPWTKLKDVPGIGPTLGRRIVRYRNKHSSIQSYEELKNIKGIGPKLLETLKNHANLGARQP